MTPDPTSLRLDGKVAIVTGSGQGIGRAIALLYAKAGASVVIAEWKAHRMQSALAEVDALGAPGHGVVVDVSRRDEVFRLIDETLERFGRLDVLVNNAQSYTPRTPLTEVTEEQMNVFLDSGVKGTLWGMQAAYPHLRGRDGRIVNFVSASGMKGESGLGAYNAAKEGIRALTRTAAREWGPDGVLVNAIAPGAMTKRGLDFRQRDPEGFARAMADRPIGRLGDPDDDIAPVALFLASPAARFLTGHTLLVDGGAHIWA